jgi:hypothetical protein
MMSANGLSAAGSGALAAEAALAGAEAATAGALEATAGAGDATAGAAAATTVSAEAERSGKFKLAQPANNNRPGTSAIEASAGGKSNRNGFIEFSV